MRAPGSIRDDPALHARRGRAVRGAVEERPPLPGAWCRISECGLLRVTLVLIVFGSMLTLAAMRAPAAVASLPSQTDGVIAFQRNDDGHGQIWLIDPRQNAPAVPLPSTAPDARPAWGPIYQPNPPDQRSDLAFQRLVGDGNWDIWKRTADADPATPTVLRFGDPEPLLAEPGNQEQPAFSDTLLSSSESPSLLAYISDNTTNHAREIWLRDESGTEHQLTTDGQTAGYANPDFAGRFRPMDPSATGTKTIGLTFERTSGGQPGIWALDIDVNAADGTLSGSPHDLRPIAVGPAELSEPSWQVTSPNQIVESNDVLFTTREAATTYLDYIEAPAFDVADVIPFLDPTQTKRYQLTGDPGGDSGGVWAPNGDQIAFTRTFASNPDLWVMSSNGTNLRRLTQDPSADLYPSWQPAQESSADIVGGHTTPGPVTRGGNRGGTGNGSAGSGRTGNGTATATRRRASPRLSIRSARWHGSRVKVAGRTARGLRGRVRVAFACGNRRRQHTQRRVRVRSARFGTTLRAPRACRRARRGVVVAAYGGDRSHRAQRVSRRVRHR